MTKDTFYFSHDYHSRSDKKMIRLLAKNGTSGIGIYWCLIEMLYEEGGYLDLSECDCIASELRTKCERIESVINDFKLFDNDGKKFWSNSVLNRLKLRDQKSQKAKESADKRWKNKGEKCEINANALRTQSEGNAKKEIKGNKIIIDLEDSFNFFLTTRAHRQLCEKHRITNMRPKFTEFYNLKVDLGEFDNKSLEDIVKHFTNWLYINTSVESNQAARQPVKFNPNATPAN